MKNARITLKVVCLSENSTVFIYVWQLLSEKPIGGDLFTWRGASSGPESQDQIAGVDPLNARQSSPKILSNSDVRLSESSCTPKHYIVMAKFSTPYVKLSFVNRTTSAALLKNIDFDRYSSREYCLMFLEEAFDMDGTDIAWLRGQLLETNVQWSSSS